MQLLSNFRPSIFAQEGYRGFYSKNTITLTSKFVNDIHKHVGTIIGTSRGGHDKRKIVDNIQDCGINQQNGSKLKSKRKASVANLSKNINKDDLLVSGDLSTLGNPYTQQEKEDFVLFQFGVDVIAPSMAEDAEAHTSMEIKGGSKSFAATLENWNLRMVKKGTCSFVATDNGSLEK